MCLLLSIKAFLLTFLTFIQYQIDMKDILAKHSFLYLWCGFSLMLHISRNLEDRIAQHSCLEPKFLRIFRAICYNTYCTRLKATSK